MGYERKRGKLADLNALLRGAGRPFSLIVGDDGASCRRALRDHARHRHAAAARFGAAVRGRDGAPAQPRRASSAQAERRPRGEGYGILQPRVGISLPSASRSWFARLFGGRAGHRSVHARRLRRLPGSVRRGLVHRQGHLRRRCVRARAGRPASPRTASSATTCSRAATRARGCERRGALRGVPGARTRRTSSAPASLDARRLADRWRGCCPCVPGARRQHRVRNPLSGARRGGRSSTTCGAASCRPR